MKSIRFYLIAALLSTVALGNFVAAIHGYRTGMSQTQALLDDQLADAAELLLTLRPGDEEVSRQPSDRLAFQIWTAGGELMQRSANSGRLPMTAFEPGYRDENFREHRWRVLSRFDKDAEKWVFVAERIDIRVGLADNIVLKSVLPIVAILPIIGIIVWLVVGNGLSLVRKLARELGAKRADDLTRLTTTDPPIELAPVVNAVNGLLQRLQDSVERERRFSVDAAHELRTPLSAIKVHVHNLKQELPGSAAGLRVLDDDLGRLGHLIEQIMLLYRTNPEHYEAQMQRIDLHALARTVIRDIYPDIDGKGQTIALEGSAPEIAGDEASLNIMLRNLLQNANKYSPEGASIRIRIEQQGSEVSLTVKDTGPGIPEGDIDRVFDRFYRVGGDRHMSAAEGCGLGLSIVHHIADLHHAKIDLSNRRDGSGLVVRVRFPLPPGNPVAGESDLR